MPSTRSRSSTEQPEAVEVTEVKKAAVEEPKEVEAVAVEKVEAVPEETANEASDAQPNEDTAEAEAEVPAAPETEEHEETNGKAENGHAADENGHKENGTAAEAEVTEEVLNAKRKSEATGDDSVGPDSTVAAKKAKTDEDNLVEEANSGEAVAVDASAGDGN